MMPMLTTLAALWTGWAISAAAGEAMARRRRRAIQHRVLVGGIRGKTTLVRLVHHGLLAAGVPALGRVTGDEPLHLLPDGTTRPAPRHGPANIRELRATMAEACRTACPVVVVENMAVEPELQSVVARRLVEPTLQLLAADAPDHLDHLPARRPSRAAVIAAALDPRAPVIVIPAPGAEELAAACRRRGLDVRIAPDTGASLRPHVAPLAAGAVAALARMGHDDPAVANAVHGAAATMGRLSVYTGDSTRWVDLLSANDPESTGRLIAIGPEAPNPLLVFLHRADRPDRLLSFEPLFGRMEACVSGDRPPGWLLRRLGVVYTPPGELPTRVRGRLVYLCGNTGGAGHQLRRQLAATAERASW
jgi:hypothetical protein